MWDACIQVVAQGIPETPRTIQAVTIAVGYQLELDREILSLRASHT